MSRPTPPKNPDSTTYPKSKSGFDRDLWLGGALVAIIFALVTFGAQYYECGVVPWQDGYLLALKQCRLCGVAQIGLTITNYVFGTLSVILSLAWISLRLLHSPHQFFGKNRVELNQKIVIGLVVVFGFWFVSYGFFNDLIGQSRSARDLIDLECAKLD